MIYIVGNGMFGRIAHDMLEDIDIESKIIDAGFDNSGTKASGNITKPSWISGLGERGKQAMKDLDRMYGLNKIEAHIIGNKTIDLFYVEREFFQFEPDIFEEVTHVGDGLITTANDSEYSGKILVAAGCWSDFLVKMPTIEAMAGVSYIFKRPQDFKPKFNIWAPYKQSIAYDKGEEVWFGDGTAIKHFNWDKSFEQRSIKHAQEMGLVDPIEKHIGYRPYVKGHKEGYFAHTHGNTWVSTGGGKNGIVLAAVQARQFVETLLREDEQF